MAIKVYDGEWETLWLPKTASTAIPKGGFVTYASGLLVKSTSSSANVVGICQRAVASTDADYALTSLIPVLVPMEATARLTIDVGTGSAVQATIGGTLVDLKDEDEADVGASSTDILFVDRVLSTTKILCRINKLGGGSGTN